MKPIDYKQYKKMQKMSLNELNRWFLSIWESGVQAGKEKKKPASRQMKTLPGIQMKNCMKNF